MLAWSLKIHSDHLFVYFKRVPRDILTMIMHFFVKIKKLVFFFRTVSVGLQ